MPEYNKISLRDTANASEATSNLKVSSDVQRADVVQMTDDIFFDKVVFAFHNNKYANAFFINDINDRAFSDLENSDNIEYNITESCMKIIDPAIDGLYMSTPICTDKSYDSKLNKFFLVIEEDVPAGCDIVYYLITDDDRVFPIKPNATIPLEILKNKPKSFRIKAVLYCNGIDYPAIRSYAILYFDQFIEDGYGLIKPSFAKTPIDYNGFEDTITLIRDNTNEDKLSQVLSSLDTIKLSYDSENRLVKIEQFDNIDGEKTEENNLIYGDYVNQFGEVEEVLLRIGTKTSFENETTP